MSSSRSFLLLASPLSCTRPGAPGDAHDGHITQWRSRAAPSTKHAPPARPAWHRCFGRPPAAGQTAGQACGPALAAVSAGPLGVRRALAQGRALRCSAGPNHTLTHHPHLQRSPTFGSGGASFLHASDSSQHSHLLNCARFILPCGSSGAKMLGFQRGREPFSRPKAVQ